jgi:hypothetical protein
LKKLTGVTVIGIASLASSSLAPPLVMAHTTANRTKMFHVKHFGTIGAKNQKIAHTLPRLRRVRSRREHDRWDSLTHCGAAATVVANFCSAIFEGVINGKNRTATGVVNVINFQILNSFAISAAP